MRIHRTATKERGVYQVISKTRKYKLKPDICFYIAFKCDGKLIWEKIGWLSEGFNIKLAVDIRSERMRTMRYGQELPQQKIKAPLFQDVWEKYKAWIEVNKFMSGRNDKHLYKNHLSPTFDNKRLNEISSFDLERLKNDLIKKGLAPATVKHVLVLFRCIWNKAIAWGLHEGTNPIKNVKLPTLQNQSERFLNNDEASILLDELKIDNNFIKKNPSEKKNPQLHDIALISIHCGLRAGEIFNLKGQDLDFENELINISDPKNKENRKVYMTKAVKIILSKRIPKSPDEYIFKDKRHGDKINSISHAFGKAVDKLGFNKGITDRRQMVTFHTLRHTFASWLALQGETILTIKELLGHKTLAMTTRYAHLTPDHKKQATLKLEKNFTHKKIEIPSK